VTTLSFVVASFPSQQALSGYRQEWLERVNEPVACHQYELLYLTLDSRLKLRQPGTRDSWLFDPVVNDM
jgi:hypothetical protein